MERRTRHPLPPRPRGGRPPLPIALAALASAVLMLPLLGGCERNETTRLEYGYRGTATATLTSADTRRELAAKNVVPAPLIPEAGQDGPPSTSVFKNLQVLTDTTVPQLTRLMTAMTQWVAPEQGCNYCHIATDYAADDLYSKLVARRMLEMTRHINTNWKDHVAETGVTCYTCHRGRPVPEYLWFAGHAIPEPGRSTGRRAGQNLATSPITTSSLPYDPFSTLLLGSGEIRVQSDTALRTGALGGRNQTENTYALMIHMSEALGVNCLFCHASRAMRDWDQSSPQRATAWYGIRMVRDLNNQFLVPLTSTFPAYRLGPNGDGPKVFCATCHQGVNKPLYGESMVGDYPVLRPVVGGAAEVAGTGPMQP